VSLKLHSRPIHWSELAEISHRPAGRALFLWVSGARLRDLPTAGPGWQVGPGVDSARHSQREVATLDLHPDRGRHPAGSWWQGSLNLDDNRPWIPALLPNSGYVNLRKKNGEAGMLLSRLNCIASLRESCELALNPPRTRLVQPRQFHTNTYVS
jgi:hypothetical protein